MYRPIVKLPTEQDCEDYCDELLTEMEFQERPVSQFCKVGDLARAQVDRYVDRVVSVSASEDRGPECI